ncbi:MAG: tripartite tricarboxylate transporter TctB family protein [Oceanospirillaceae bacterium]|nr:tripartite tricarboxylate transporter TctB family protein [Oceanospirillaceae bacterium]
MTIAKDRIGALIFLALSIGYGLSIPLIPVYPGDEYEIFTAKTLPTALAIIGSILSLALLYAARGAKKSALPELDWAIAIKLIALMVSYGVILEPLGFLIATTIFLLCGYWLLGERRKWLLFSCSLPLVLCFWYGLTQLLDIYLAPGLVMQWIGGL